MVDSLLLGCIPVLFHPAMRAQWPWHWGEWVANATVLLPHSSILDGSMDPIAHLAAIPAGRVAAMRAVIAQRAFSMQYSVGGDAPGGGAPRGSVQHAAPSRTEHLVEDAFDVALRRAWVLARDRKRQEEGRAMQRGGEATDAAVEQFERDGDTARGFCAPTTGGPGNCSRDVSGSWRLGGRSKVVSLDTCSRRCEACARCHYFSLSHVHHECSWYTRCNRSQLQLSLGGWSYKTRTIDRASV